MNPTFIITFVDKYQRSPSRSGTKASHWYVIRAESRQEAAARIARFPGDGDRFATPVEVMIAEAAGSVLMLGEPDDPRMLLPVALLREQGT